jgi:hypothetical protein
VTRRLDPRTLERASAVICDLGGDRERHGWQLERLLRDAGWPDPPDYDGSPRIAWLRDALVDRADRPDEIARVLCRACDPLEHDGSRAVAEAFRAALNEVLEPEQLTIATVSGRPVLGRTVGDLGTAPVFGRPDDLQARLTRLLDDPAMVALLVDRAEQSHRAQQSGAHLLALFGIGSLVEGLLLAVLLHRDPALELRDTRGRTVGADRAGLELLLDAAHSRGHIELDAKAFMTPVRNFRNYIHPRRQAAEAFNPDQETVSLCWGPVHAVLNDLEQSAPP